MEWEEMNWTSVYGQSFGQQMNEFSSNILNGQVSDHHNLFGY